MEAREYRTVDKSGWAPGPWQSEPDKMQWTDEATGLPCLIVRGPFGALCGYVGVAEGHVAFAQHYERVGVDVHGGLTFADFCADTDDESRHICHTPAEGEPTHVWWLGFDCAHCDDLCPSDRGRQVSGEFFRHRRYRDLAYVKSEIATLAAQLSKLTALEPERSWD
jgi:hypothetical protein